MRPILATVGLCSLMAMTGCSPNWSFLRNNSSDKGIPPNRPATSAELVTYLNLSSQRVRSMTCQDVDIECSQGIQSVGGIRGKMACEQPRDFRMSAMLMGKNELDLGSNEREFWFWVAKSQQPGQFYCSYNDLKTKSVQLPFPFQPEWIMETLGMSTYPVDGRYQVVDKRDTIELIQDAISLQGQPVRKVVVFNRNQMANGHQIRAYVLRDMQGKELCAAQIQAVQQVGNITVPYKVHLEWPAEKLKLSMQINKPSLNQLPPEMAQNLFVRPTMKDIPSYDLANLGRGPSSGQVQQAGGYAR
jgi:hypothetical protein